jgi:predicted nucleotidyltransferase
VGYNLFIVLAQSAKISKRPVVTAVQVPAIDKRKRIPEKAIRDVVRQIAEKFHPQKIILFGSYARGKPRPESDVDLLVIMETQLKETRQALLIDKSLERDLFGLDLLVRTPANLQERIAMGDSFLKEIVMLGKVLYESPDN